MLAQDGGEQANEVSAPNHGLGVSMWHAYILRCQDDTFYVGSTSDISRRVKEHIAGKGGAYTRTRIPVELVYQEAFPDRSSAQQREAQVKRWTRSKKEALISHNHELLRELSRSRD